MAKATLLKKIYETVGRGSRKAQGKKAKIQTRSGQKKGSPHYKTTEKGQHKSVSQKTTSKYDKKVGKVRTKQTGAVVGGAGTVALLSQAGKKGEPAQKPEGTANGFGAAFRKARNDYLNDRSKAKTFDWKGNKYHVRIKGETPAMLETQRGKTLSGDFSKTGAKKAVAKKPVRKRRVARLKKRQARAAKRKSPLIKGRTTNLQKRIDRLEKKAGGGLATNDLGLRNRPEKKAVRAMKKGAGKSVAAKVKRTSVPKNKKNMDLAPKRRKGASIKGYQGGGVADKIAWQEQQPAARISTRGPYASGRPHKVAGFGDINPNEPTNVRQRPGGMKTGGMAKKQGYSAKLDESLGVRHPGKKTQSLKSRRAESKGAEKAAGKRAYAAVKTMDKGTRKAKPRGVGVAKRGYGKALS